MSTIFPFSFLLNDSRLTTPGPLDTARSPLTNKRSDKVAVIRLFGYSSSLEISDLTASRQCCVNIHGYFPKLFMDVVPGITPAELAEVIDSRIGPGGDSACVYNITKLRRKNFYGFHKDDIEIGAVYAC